MCRRDRLCGSEEALTATSRTTRPLEQLCRTHTECQVHVVEDISRLTLEALQRDRRYVQPLFLWDALDPLHIAVAPASNLKGGLRAVLDLTLAGMLQQKHGHIGDVRATYSAHLSRSLAQVRQ